MAKLFSNDTIGSSYREQLQREHDGSNWGSTGGRYAGTGILDLLRERPYIQRVLDFGAGKASLEDFIRERLDRDIDWTNYDPGIPDYDVMPSGTFDLVVNSDVLEHVEPEKLPTVLEQLKELTGKVLYCDIACYPTGKVFGEGPYKGEDLHLIVESPDWWYSEFDKLEGLRLHRYESSKKASKGGYKERCVLIYEKV